MWFSFWICCAAINVCVAALAVFNDWNRMHGLSERYHAHHDTYTVPSALTRSLSMAALILSLVSALIHFVVVRGYLVPSNGIIATFFIGASGTMLIAWATMRRLKVSVFDTELIVRPGLSRTRTIQYQDITRMQLFGPMLGTGFRSLKIETQEGATLILGLVSIDRILMRVDRFDALIN